MAKGIRSLASMTLLRLIRDSDDASLCSMVRVALAEVARRRQIHEPSATCDSKCRTRMDWLLDQVFPDALTPFVISGADKGLHVLSVTPAGRAWELMCGGDQRREDPRTLPAKPARAEARP